MKRTVFLLSLCMFLIVSCERLETESQVSNVNFTPCQQSELRSSSEVSSQVDVGFTTEGVKLKYNRFEVQCDFTTVKVTHTFANGVLNITQQGDGDARCLCYTDVSYTISGISQNQVNVIFINGVQVYCHNVTDSEKLCLYLNSENVDKIIPVVNEYLAKIKSDLPDEQKIQMLAEWLKSSSCVIDATILCVSCIETLPAQSEISFSFRDGKATKEVILDILMTNPLKASICSIEEKEQTNFDQDVIISADEYKNAPNDPKMKILSMEIEGDYLKIIFNSGGCSGNTWVVKLIGWGNYDKSNPPQTTLRLSLDNKEMCEALIHKEVTFNLEPLKEYFRHHGTNKLYLNISGKGILYEY